MLGIYKYPWASEIVISSEVAPFILNLGQNNLLYYLLFLRRLILLVTIHLTLPSGIFMLEIDVIWNIKCFKIIMDLIIRFNWFIISINVNSINVNITIPNNIVILMDIMMVVYMTVLSFHSGN